VRSATGDPRAAPPPGCASLGDVAGLRCVIDSMVFDAIVAEPGLLADVDRLTSARRLELLAAAETMREIARTPGRARRRELQRVRVLVVAPVPGRWPAIRSSLDDLLETPGVSDADARIAMAAAVQRAPLVTEDRPLRLAVAAALPAVAVWTWEADLRPRLEGLAAAPPALAPRHRSA
jgi:predicted nucleic acid-binding protein